MKTDVASGFSAHLGSVPVVGGDQRSRWSVGGIVPGVVALPRSVDQLAEVLGRASLEGWSVLPAGRGSWLGGGGLPSEADVVVSTGDMKKVVEYVPDDLTLTGGAGLALGRLASTTREHGQWLAQDPPGWRETTLGAFAATGIPGPLVAGFGRPRDHLLGLTAVTGDGRILRPGGKVVKNVAGFDLVRLLAGSWGTLGVIASVTVRLFPLPRTEVTLLLEERLGEGVPPALLECARAWAVAPVVPEALELVVWSSDEERAGRATLAARLLGSPEEVAGKERILREAAGGSEPRRVEGVESQEFQDLLTRGPGARVRAGRDGGSGRGPRSSGGTDGGSALSIRLAALPARLGPVLEVAENLRSRAGATGCGTRIRASVTRGTVSVELSSDATPDAAFPPKVWGPLLESSRAGMSRLGGNLTVLRSSRSLQDRISARGPMGPAGALMEGIRKELDPAGILAPGRLDGRTSKVRELEADEMEGDERSLSAEPADVADMRESAS